jgi:diaphanous
MFKNMTKLFSELSDFYAFDTAKYTFEEFYTDIKSFKDSFLVNNINNCRVAFHFKSALHRGHTRKMSKYGRLRKRQREPDKPEKNKIEKGQSGWPTREPLSI